MSNTDVTISHNINTESIEQVIIRYVDEVNKNYHISREERNRRIELIHELASFDFGKFLLTNKGANGYWTDYFLTYPQRVESGATNPDSLPELERFLLQEAPIILATQERFQHFLRLNQSCVKSGATLGCVPAGLMGELLYLDYTGVEEITLVGVDTDEAALESAEQQAVQTRFTGTLELIQHDAWTFVETERFDLLSSNGLNIYEPDANRVQRLYSKFYQTLKPGGTLVTSFVTPPPSESNATMWDMTAINPDHLALQKTIFSDIIGAKWQCYTAVEEMKAYLEEAGFSNIQFYFDKAKCFPTVVAFKT